jgi:hypothetical protein
MSSEVAPELLARVMRRSAELAAEYGGDADLAEDTERRPSPVATLGYSHLVFEGRAERLLFVRFMRPSKLDAALLGRAREVRQRPRERRARRRSRTVGSRGDPSEPDDDPDLETPLQRAQLSFLAALTAAAEAGLKTHTTFLDLAATRIAAEVSFLLDQEERP